MSDKQYRILYVEDQKFEMQGIISKLQKNFELTIVRDRSSATNLLLSNKHSFDLMLLDIRLVNPTIPNRNDGRTAGIEFVKFMQQSFLEQDRALPIIVYTAQPLTEKMRKDLSDAGVREIVRKTGSGRELLKFIRQVLKDEYEK